MIWNKNIFKKNDIRGIYKKDFDLLFVKNLAFGFICFYFPLFKKKPIIAIGHDCRLSSPEIASHLAKSLTQAGADVLFLGMIPSPVCFFASYVLPIQASIMVTASHNPSVFNGFKIMLNKKTICDKELIKFKNFIKKESFVTPLTVGKIKKINITNPYISFYTKQFLPSDKKKLLVLSPKNKKLFIAIDCGSGSSGIMAQKVFKALNLPIKIHWLYATPDGHFPYHPPDPSSEKNLKDLKKIIKQKKCDFGVAFDGDGDRLVIVTKKGQTLKGDELMSIFISDILNQSNNNNKHIVVDVKCGDWFFKFLKQKKVITTMWKSGHSLIRQKTLEKNALFGGEFSGHFFFCDDYFPIDDGVYSLLRLLKIYFKTGKTPEKLIIKKTHIETTELRIPTDILQAKKQIKFLKSYYLNKKSAQCCFIDGARVSLSNSSWGLARLSNTQNEWTFRFGGKNKEDLQKIQKTFYRLLKVCRLKVYF